MVRGACREPLLNAFPLFSEVFEGSIPHFELKFCNCKEVLHSKTLQDFYKYYIEKGNRARAAENASRPSLKQFYEAFKGVSTLFLL